MILFLATFLIFLILFVISPAIALFYLTGAILENDPLVKIGLVLTFGVLLLILLMAISQMLGLPPSFIWLIPAVSALLIILNRKSSPKTSSAQTLVQSKPLIFILLFILISSVIQSFPLLKGYRSKADGLHFPSVHDNLWNISIINSLLADFPPQHPAIAGYTLKNHHYLYLYFLTLVNKVTRIGIFDLYFKFGPVFVSFLYGLSIYAVSSLFTKKFFIRALSVFMGYYAGNLAYLAHFFFPKITDWRGNLFFADQPFDQIFNPYSVLGFAVFLFSIYSLAQFLKQKKLSFYWLIISAILISVSFGIKSFAGIILISALSVLTLIVLIFYRDKRIIILLSLSLLIFLPLLFLIATPEKVSLKIAPGWLLREMMVGEDKLNQPQYADIEDYYRSINNRMGLIKIKSIGLTIYLIGNLGVRLLGFFYLLKLIFKRNLKPYLKITVVFITLTVLISLTLPLIFNLSASPYNVVQFTPYGLVLLSILTALVLGDLYQFFRKKNLAMVGLFTIVIAVLLAVPVNVKNFLEKFTHTGDKVNQQELEILAYLKDSAGKNDLILIYPDQFITSAIYIPALSGKRVYLADPSYARQTGIDPSPRLAEIDRFFQSGGKEKDFLQRNKIAYIYLLKQQALSQFDNMYQIVKENDRAILLKVK